MFCKECKFQFPNKNKLIQHDCQPSKVEEIINCRYCSLHFQDDNVRRKHEESCRTEKCVICDKWMKAKNLMRHMKSAHIDGDHEYNCKGCSYTTSRKDLLAKFSKTLYNLSDQTIESTHQEFAKRMEAGQFNMKNYRSVIHGKKLLRRVIHFNSLNFGYGV